MRNIIIAVIVLLLVISLGIFEQVYFSRELLEEISLTSELITMLESDNLDEAREVFKRLNASISKNDKLIELAFTHSEYKDLPLYVSELSGYMDVSNIDEAIVRANIVKSDLIGHYNMLRYSIVNIL